MRQRDLADLVEEQRAAVGLLEAALAARDGAGERALLVPEQLALEQALGERRAVEAHERAGSRAASCWWMRRGDQLLAGAALAVISTVARLGADLRDGLEQALHRRVLADDVVRTRCARERVAQLAGLVRRASPSRIARSTSAESASKSSGLVR